MSTVRQSSDEGSLFSADSLETLLRINQSLLTIQDLEPLLDQIVHDASSVLKADVVVLYVYEEERDDVRMPPVISGTLKQGHVLRTTSTVRPHRQSAVFKMLKRQLPLYAPDARVDWTAALGDWAWEGSFIQREEIVASAAIPLTASGKTAGVMFVNYRTPNSFPESERRVIELFAVTAAIAIQNARQLARERTLREVSSAIASEEDMKANSESILDQLNDVIEYRRASLQLVKGDQETRRLLAARGFDLETADKWFLRPISQDPLIQRIVESRKPLILSETEKDLSWGRHPGTEDVRSWAGVPLLYDREVVGLLTIDHDRPGFYTPAIAEHLASFARGVAVHVRNARVFDTTQRQIRDLEIVNHIVQLLGTKLEPAKLMDAIVTEIATRLVCTHCTIFLPKEEQGEVVLVPKETYGVRREQIMARRFKPGEGLAGWVFANGKPELFTNALADERFSPATEPRDQPRSMMVVPIKIGDETIGVISADQDELNWFSDSDLRLLTALAQHIGVAIQQANGLDLLHRISNRIVTVPHINEDEILEEIAAGAIELTRTSTGVIFLIAQDGRTVTRTVELPKGFNHPRPRMESGITRQIVDTGKVMVFPDVRQSTLVNPEMHGRVWSMIGVPLIVGERVIGVLFLNDKEPHEFTEFEVSLLSTLASQAAIAIKNARYVRSLRFLNDVETQLTGAIDEANILELVVHSAAKTFECTHCTVFQVQKDQIVVEASHGNRGPTISKGRSFKLGEGVAGWVAEAGQSRLVPDTAEDEHFARGWNSPELEPASLVVAPIILDVGTYGVISVEHDQVNAFDEHDLQLLETLALQVAQAVRNARLNAQLQSLHQVLQERNLDKVLDRIVEGICTILGSGTTTAIWMYSDQTHKFGRYHAYGPLKDQISVPPRDEGTGRHVVDTRKPLYLEDVREQKPNQVAIRQESLDAGIKSFAALPLVQRDSVVGALFINIQRSFSFSPQVQTILEIFARQAAVAIYVGLDLEQKIHDLERKVLEFDVLTKIGRVVANLGIDEILDLIYDQAGRVMDLRDAQVQFAFYDEARQEVTFPLAVEQDNGRVIDRVRWGKRETQYRKPDESENVDEFQPRQSGGRFGLTEYVIHTREPKLIAEDFVRRAAGLKIEDHAVQVWDTFGRLKRPTFSWLGVPMMVHDEVLGIISIQSLEVECAFDEGHVALLQAVANQAAVAIKNVRLLEREKAHVTELEGLRQIGLKITSSLDLQEVMRAIADNTNRILGSDFTTIFPYGQQQGFGEGAREGTISTTPSIPSENGMTFRVMTALQITPQLDAEQYPGINQDFIHEKGIKSFLGVPVKFGDKPVGVILANYQTEHPFTDHELGLAEQIAALAAVAIENTFRAQFIADEERYGTMIGLAADLVHRINNLAGTIPLRAQYLEELLSSASPDYPAMREEIEGIARDAGNLLAESDKLKELRESETAPEPTIVRVRERLRSIAGKVRVECPKNIKVIEAISPDLPSVCAVAEELDHALWNVADNAVKAMPNGGPLTIQAHTVERDGHTWVEISITDEGVGIPPELRDSIFEPFYSTRPGAVHGFGLWRARQVFRKLGGTIELVPTDKPGTTFVISLPAVTASAEVHDEV